LSFSGPSRAPDKISIIDRCPSNKPAMPTLVAGSDITCPNLKTGQPRDILDFGFAACLIMLAKLTSRRKK
jgi:hypothetical protein